MGVMPRNTPLFPDIVVHYVCLEGKVFHEMYQHFQAKQQHALVNHNSTLSAVILLIASKADFFW